MNNATVSFFNDFFGMSDVVKTSRVSRTVSFKESAKRARKAQRVARRNNRK